VVLLLFPMLLLLFPLLLLQHTVPVACIPPIATRISPPYVSALKEHSMKVHSKQLPAKAKSHISRYSGHDHLMVWVLEYKARGFV
jgi:hypothetical protein